MSVFHIGIDDDSKDCWTDTPTLWIGATGSGKSSRFVARSVQKAREHGDCQIVDVGGETDLLTGERIARALSHAELQKHAANLMEEALFMTPVTTPVILDEPRSVEGDYERWVKEIVFSAEKNDRSELRCKQLLVMASIVSARTCITLRSYVWFQGIPHILAPSRLQI